MKTMCPPGYHHNGFVTTHALGHMYGMSCEQAIIVITGRAHCFRDCIGGGHIVFVIALGSSGMDCVLIILFQLYESKAVLFEGNFLWVDQYDPPQKIHVGRRIPKFLSNLSKIILLILTSLVFLARKKIQILTKIVKIEEVKIHIF